MSESMQTLTERILWLNSDREKQDATIAAQAAEIERLREQADEWKLAHESSEAVLHMAVCRLGGCVEGRPTARLNFLQRIDALRAIEARAALAGKDGA